MIIKLLLTFIFFFSLDNLLGIFIPRTLFGFYVIVPYSLLIAICLQSFFDDDDHLPIFAFIFGFIVDIYQANLIGLYSALFLIIAVIIKKYIVLITPLNFVSILYITATAIVAVEVIVFALVSFVMRDTMTIFRFLQHRLVITLVFNVLLLTIMYWPLVKIYTPKDDKKRKIKAVMTDNTQT